MTKNMDIGDGARIENASKASALYDYLLKFAKLRQQPTVNLANCSKKAIAEFPDDPVNITINYCDTVVESESDAQGDELPLLVIHKPEFEKCPPLPAELSGWMANGWNSHCCAATIFPAKYKSSGLPAFGEIGDENDIEYFEDDPNRQKTLDKWLKKRIDWVNRQKAIDKTRRLFEIFYGFHMEMQRDSENLELVIANGFIESSLRSNVKYPILAKKVRTEFNARKSSISIYDGDSAPELYSDVFEAFDEMHLEHLSALKDSLARNGYHPLDRNETPGFLKEVIATLTPHGFYCEREPAADWKTTYKFVCYWKPIYVLRRRQDDSVRFIEKIIENINETGFVPSHIAEIVSPGKVEEPSVDSEESFIEKLASIGGESSEILLAKEANREQLDIAKRIGRSNAVVVQGPPGTGKTHTIANLLGHFLAKGKSVLVTSFTTKALKVLKEKVPDKIQPLCVSVIDDDKTEMMRSVNGITDWMARITSARLNDEMRSLAEDRKDVLTKLGELRQRLFAIRHQECQTIVYDGESLSPSAAADFVAQNEGVLDYIPGDVAVGHSLPLTLEELITLYRTNTDVSLEEQSELSLQLPNPETLLSPEAFESYTTALRQNETALEGLSRESGWSFSYDDSRRAISVNMDQRRCFRIPRTETNAFDELLNIAGRFEELEPWMKHAAVDGKANGIAKKKWHVLADRILEVCELSEQLDLDSFGKEIALPSLDGQARVDFLSDISEMYKFTNAGGTIGKFKILVNPRWKKTLSMVSINGQPLSGTADFKLMCDIFALQEKRRDCARFWDQLIHRAGAKKFVDLDAEKPEVIARNFVELIRTYTEWYQTDYAPLNKILSSLSIDAEMLFGFTPLDSDLQRTDKIFRSVFSEIKTFVEGCRFTIRVQDIKDVLSDLRSKVVKKSPRSLVCHELCIAVEGLDAGVYREAYSALKELYDKYAVISGRERLLDNLRPFAPEWAEAIRSRSGVHGQCKIPDNILGAWKWKQYSALLAKLMSEDYDILQKKIAALVVEYRDLTAKYIAASAKFHLIKRTESDRSLKASLTGWAKTVQAIGRTNTPRAIKMRQEARKLMVKCQRAVPAWIMPISKAMASLDPVENRFDVVIVDEASQADITTLAIAYMAKKLIIVGDDKQVTPISVGTQYNKVQALIATHLNGHVENAHLYNERSSIYDIAGTTYTTLMLTEHFRCVPEIIGFSNMLSYDNRIKPLRDPTTSALLPHVVGYRSKDGARNGNINENEAMAVVALMKACLEQEEYEGKTFGVIAMLGSEQTALIQRIISERISLREIEERRILCGEPPHFQGDERDVVFMSIVDSRKDSGPLACIRADANMNLWRKRYNVAASRAKDQLWVVHSLDAANDLQSEDIRKLLLDYTSDPASFISEIQAVERRAESPFEKEVANALMSRGYHIVPQYSVGAYRIDFVVMYHGKKVALECDGERYHCREEDIRSDMERQQILERLGWRFVRLRGGEYYRNKEKAINRVVAYLTELGVKPEKWEEEAKRAPVSRSSALLERVKARANAILKEWEDEAKAAEEKRKAIIRDAKELNRRRVSTPRDNQTNLFGFQVIHG